MALKDPPKGTETLERKPKLECDNCGAPLVARSRFCPDCGRPVKASGSRLTFGPRYAAFLVDVTVVMGLWIVSTFVAAPFGSIMPRPTGDEFALANFSRIAGSIVAILLLPIVALAYFAICEGRSGRTIGKKILGTRVRTLSKSRPGYARSFLRAFVIWGPLLLLVVGQIAGLLGRRTLGLFLIKLGAPLFIVFGLATLGMVLFSRQRRGLHDIIAGTEVVRD